MQDKSILNILFIALIILGSYTKLNLGTENENTNLYEALNIIIQEQLTENDSRLVFYSYFKNHSLVNRFYGNDAINGVLQRISNVSYQVFHQQKKRFFNLRQNEVILLDNMKAFR